MAEIDDSVGQIIKALEDAGIAKNTLVIFSSDNGPWKLHIALISQTGDSYGFTATREKPLLFNVEEDLGERIDRASEHPEIVARMLEKLDAIKKSF
jgi:membrane-anchored protein YejM (alkaline phosphatase superfamily)